MAVTGPMLEAACSQALHGSTSSATRAQAVSVAVTNYVAQYAAGAPIDDSTGPFTEFAPTRIPLATLGAGAVAVNITLTYIPIEGGAERQQTVAGVAGTSVQFPNAVQQITRVQTDVDPGDTLDIQTGDTQVSPAPRFVYANGGGDLVCRLVEDDADATFTLVAGANLALRPNIVRASGTAASVLLLW